MDGLPIARIAGIEIRISLAWVFLLALVTVLGSQAASQVDGRLPPLTTWIIGGVVALGFLVTVLAHELAHTIAARRRGVAVDTVVVGFIGGTSPFDVQGATARDEIAIAVAGPALSLAVGTVLTGVGMLGDDEGVGGAVASGAVVVGVLNLILGVLSLLPGMPLDGGRIVRAVAWARTGSPQAGARTSARLGRATGWVLVGLGAVVALVSGPAEGLMLMSLGWLVATGARAVERRLALETLLDGVPVRAAMEPDVPRIAPHLTLDTFAERFAGGRDGSATTLPVVEADRLVGVVGVDRLRRIGRRRWSTTRASDVMVDAAAAPPLAVDSPLWDALETLRRSGVDGLAVLDAGSIAGVLTRRSAASLIRDRMRAEAGAAR